MFFFRPQKTGDTGRWRRSITNESTPHGMSKHIPSAQNNLRDRFHWARSGRQTPDTHPTRGPPVVTQHAVPQMSRPASPGLEGWGIDVIVCQPDVGGPGPCEPGGNTDIAPCPDDQRRIAAARADSPQEQQARGVKTYDPAADHVEASLFRRKLCTGAKTRIPPTSQGAATSPLHGIMVVTSPPRSPLPKTRSPLPLRSPRLRASTTREKMQSPRAITSPLSSPGRFLKRQSTGALRSPIRSPVARGGVLSTTSLQRNAELSCWGVATVGNKPKLPAFQRTSSAEQADAAMARIKAMKAGLLQSLQSSQNVLKSGQTLLDECGAAIARWFGSLSGPALEKAIRETFEKFDTDSSGRIDREEFAAAMHVLVFFVRVFACVCLPVCESFSL